MHLATRLLVLACLLVAPVAAVASTIVVLQNGSNGYVGTSDNWLDASLPRDNHGASPDLHVQWSGGHSDCVLLRFDLAGWIPSGASILSATLSLYYTGAYGFLADDAITIKPYRLQASAWWDESAYDGQTGVGSSYRFRDASEIFEWTNGAQGGWYDKVDDLNGTAKIKRADGTPQDATAPGSWVTFDVAASVNQWKIGQANNGFLLVATSLQGTAATCYGTFESRNDGAVGYRPKLTIAFEAPVGTESRTWSRIKTLYR